MAAGKTVLDERAMREVMDLLNEWQAPEPSVWFDGKMMARFREEQNKAPAGWFARMRDRFVFGSPVSFRPVLAGAMALVLVAGGGSYLGVAHLQGSPAMNTSATVQDLQVLDNNDQAIQQMDQLLDTSDDSNSSSL